MDIKPIPGMPVMNPKCTGCGRRDLATAAFNCAWPDGRTSVERYCNQCRVVWRRQLESLGAKFSLIAETGEG
jgi:hypothetical protein